MTRLNIVQDLYEYKIPKNVGHSITKSIQTVVTDLSLKGKEGLLCKGKV